jgi:hypothetical protein
MQNDLMDTSLQAKYTDKIIEYTVIYLFLQWIILWYNFTLRATNELHTRNALPVLMKIQPHLLVVQPSKTEKVVRTT